MKKWILLSFVLGVMPLSMLAQDDVYFVPKKKIAAEQRQYSNDAHTERHRIQPIYHSGSSRSVDEYNRHGGSYYEPIVCDSSDVINFDGKAGVYPDSLEDYHYTRQMTRFDDYTPAESYWQGYSEGVRDSWHSPWYYSSYYPWYDSWYYDRWYYDPWYYGNWGWSWHWGYYDPWLYGWHRPYYGWYAGWSYPYHYHSGGGVYHRSNYRPSTGTMSHGRIIDSGRRSTYYSRNASNRGIGASRSSGVTDRSIGRGRSSVSTRSNNTYTPTRSTSGSTYSPSRSSSGSSYTPSRSSSSSSGSIGSSRSGGGSFGGGRSGGGGGGSRSAGRR